jgi:hypothetical protein
MLIFLERFLIRDEFKAGAVSENTIKPAGKRS